MEGSINLKRMVKGVAQDVETYGSVDICHVSYPVVLFLTLILIIARRQYRDHVLASPNMIVSNFKGTTGLNTVKYVLKLAY